MIPPVSLSAANTNQAAPPPCLVRAAHEFEAQLMKELLKPLTSGDGLTGSDDDSGSNGALGEYASESLGRSISMAGGFGIANRIISQVSHFGNQPTAAPVTQTLPIDTAVRTNK